MMVWPTMAVGWVVNMHQSASAALGRINEIFMAEPEIADPQEAAPVRGVEGAIEFRNVSFSYPDNDGWVLRDVSFKVPAGACYAIVGPIGSGKTTLLETINGMLSYTAGSGYVFGKLGKG